MKNLKAKLRKKGGFTLVEMLIVVAIIAILIAVSVPMVGNSLESAREAVDESNARAAISLATIEVLTKNINEDKTWGYVVSGANGSLNEAANSGSKGKSSTVKEVPLTVTYHHDNGTFTVPDEYQALLVKAGAAAVASNNPNPNPGS